MDETGKLSSSLVIHVRFDVCPTWLGIALRHLAAAKQRSIAREAAWAGSNEEIKRTTLEEEFEASMQAIVAAAIALDAFYAILKTHVQIPSNLTDTWRSKRTARYVQITEVIRRAFHLKGGSVSVLRKNLKEIYRLRDIAVHPSGKIEPPVLHPELNVAVESRFFNFRAYHAELVVTAAAEILWVLAEKAKPTEKGIQDYVNALRVRLMELFPDGPPVISTPVSGSNDTAIKIL